MKLLLQCMLLLLPIWLFAFNENEYGVIKGKVVTNDSKVAEDVSILISSLQISTVTNENGEFELTRMKPGTYTLSIALTGYTTIEKIVTVTANSITIVNVQLQLSSQQLQEVIVSSNANRFAKKKSTFVAKMPLLQLENPQAYSVVSKALLQEQVISNFDDALKNVPGLDKLWTSTGRGGDGAAYFSLRGFSVQPSMVNGIASQTNGGLDPANIDQIEVIKGPSGTLFGSSLVSFGGLINIVTKKPFETTKGEISYTNGTFGLNRLTADYNTALNVNKTVLFRLNTAYHSENSFQDAGFRKSFFIAPSLTYQVSEKVNFHFNAELYQAEATNPVMVFLNRSRKLQYTTPQALNIDYYKSFTSNDITIKTPTVSFFAQMNVQLNKRWLSQTSFSQSVRKSDGLYSYIMFLQPTNDTLLTRLVSSQNAVGTTTNIQQNFIGDFTIGKMRNRLVAGIDVANLKTLNNSTAYIQFDMVNSLVSDSRYAQITRQAVDAKIAANTAPTKASTHVLTYGAYVSNVLNITEQLLVMTSVRVDKFDNKGSKNYATGITSGSYQQTAVSPKLGLIYAVVKNKVSIFSNYMNGFRNVAPTTQPDGSVAIFKPQQANQWEVGIKLDAFAGKLTGTISYYDIRVTNVLIPDPNRVGFTIQEGNIVSKGFEADVITTPINGMQIVAGYSYNNSKNTNAAPATNGRRPTNAGPENLINLWVSYTLQNGAVKGLGAGFGGNYASENYITNSLATGEFIVPAYTIINASVFYNQPMFRIGLKLDNCTNTAYWKGWSTIEPQMPRRLSANLTFRF